MGSAKRQWVNISGTGAIERGRESKEHEYFRRQAAEAIPIPNFRYKMVKMASGHMEIVVMPSNHKHVINARMGFNPLLDCRRRTNLPDDVRERKDAENLSRSLKRTRQGIRYSAKQARADRLFTLTYRENMQDRARCHDDVKYWLKLYRLKHPRFQFVAVPELQDRGAYHVHLAVAGHIDIKWARRCWWRVLGIDDQVLKDYELRGVLPGSGSPGNVDVTPPRNAARWNTGHLASYIAKYVSKDLSEGVRGVKRFWHSAKLGAITIIRGWLQSEDWQDAVMEADQILKLHGAVRQPSWSGECSHGNHLATRCWAWLIAEFDLDKVAPLHDMGEIDIFDDEFSIC